MQRGQRGIKRDGRHAGDHFHLAVDGAVFVCSPVIIAEGNQGTYFQAALRAFGSAGAKLILHNRGVFSMHHEYGLLQLDAVDLVRKHGKRVEAKALQVLLSLRVDRFGILIAGKLNAVLSENQCFFQLREQRSATGRGSSGSPEQAMVAAGGLGGGGRGGGRPPARWGSPSWTGVVCER